MSGRGKNPVPPPALTNAPQSICLDQLWQRLALLQRQQLCQALSLLID